MVQGESVEAVLRALSAARGESVEACGKTTGGGAAGAVFAAPIVGKAARPGF